MLEFLAIEEEKSKEDTMEESLSLDKKSYGTETDTETQYLAVTFGRYQTNQNCTILN